MLLLVEDDDDLRALYAFVLTELGGHQVQAVASLDEYQQGDRPHVLLLDGHAPGRTPEQTLAHARALFGLQTPILAISGDREFIGRAAELGLAGGLLKPFTPSKLIAAVEALNTN